MTAEFIVAVHSIEFLYHKGESKTSDEIAENVCANPVTIRRVMTKLKKAGIVTASRSFTGGYTLSLDAAKLTLYDIFKATANHIVKVRWRSGDHQAKCPISRGMEPIMDELFAKLDDAGKEILEKITIGNIDSRIFDRKEETKNV